jgi:hypothetical protein
LEDQDYQTNNQNPTPNHFLATGLLHDDGRDESELLTNLVHQTTPSRLFDSRNHISQLFVDDKLLYKDSCLLVDKPTSFSSTTPDTARLNN